MCLRRSWGKRSNVWLKTICFYSVTGNMTVSTSGGTGRLSTFFHIRVAILLYPYKLVRFPDSLCKLWAILEVWQLVQDIKQEPLEDELFHENWHSLGRFHVEV